MLIIALICFLYAANIGWNSFHFAQLSKSALQWPVTEGRVSVTRGGGYKTGPSVSVVYIYSVSGREYRGNSFALPRANALDWTPSRWKNGQNVLVYFDPAAPQNSTLSRQLDEKEYFINLVCAALASLLGAWAFAAFINDMTSHKAKLGFR